MTAQIQRTSEQWEALLRRNRIKPTKSMGQNFLTDTSVVEEIAWHAELAPGDLVIEIGPGLGILTRQLIASGADVIGVELDREIAIFLKSDLAEFGNFHLVEQDARYLEPEKITDGRPYKVAANLPYSVATVILRNLMESGHPPTRMTVMVQKEVAERMTAEPGDMSLLGLATDLYAESEIILVVPPGVFIPPPKVESAVVQMDIRPELRGTQAMRDRMFELATMAFQRKRKTIGNGLAMGLDRSKAEVEEILDAAGLDPKRRPQTLSVDEWLHVAELLP